MVRDNATLIFFDDITSLLPAGVITLLMVSVNFVLASPVLWPQNRNSLSVMR